MENQYLSKTQQASQKPARLNEGSHYPSKDMLSERPNDSRHRWHAAQFVLVLSQKPMASM